MMLAVYRGRGDGGFSGMIEYMILGKLFY